LERARELSEKAGDYVNLFEILWFLALLSVIRLDHQKGLVFCQKALGIALLQRNPEMAGNARSLLGYSHLYAGNFLTAMNELAQAGELSAIAHSKPGLRPFDWQIESQIWVSFTYWPLGFPQRATDKSKEALARARELKAPPADLCSALWFAAALNLMLKNSEIADEYIEECMKLAAESGLIVYLPLTALLRGWALALKGHLDEGLGVMVQCRSGVIPIIFSWMYMAFAEVYLAADRVREGLEATNEGLDLAENTGTRVLEAETRRLKGELLLKCDGAVEEAAQCFHDAIDVARKQGAKSFELRATISLARLLASQGRRGEVQTMLADIYNWFTEGFDTADLKDAKALLDRLGSEP
jgi:tetratricopeptide (TPR) repeat protein